MSSIDGLSAQHYNGCTIFQNEKVLLLTTRKIAHSRCRQIFKDFLLSDGNELFNFSVRMSTLELEPSNIQKESEYFEKINTIWNSFLEKKEKRDLVILYRNPIEQFISSFMQDFTYVPPHSNYFLLDLALIHYFLQNISAPPLDKSIFLEKYKKNGLTKDMFFEHNKIFVEFIKMFFEFYITNGTYSDSHYTPWLTFVSNLYYSDKIDKNKIKFIDIYENPLEKSLENYFDEVIKPVHRFDVKYKAHSFLFEYMENLIRSDRKYKNITENILNSDILFYNKLKNNQL